MTNIRIIYSLIRNFIKVFFFDLFQNKINSLVSNCPGGWLFFVAEGRLAETRALFSLIVAASTVFCRLKLLPPLPVTAAPVTAVAWLWFVALPGLGAPPNGERKLYNKKSLFQTCTVLVLLINVWTILSFLCYHFNTYWQLLNCTNLV